MSLITTERLELRRFRLNDLMDFYAFAQNPNIGPDAGWEPHKSALESFEVLIEYRKQKTHWVVTEKGIDRFIGSISLRLDEKRLNPSALALGYSLDEPYWGQGYMSEASLAVIHHAFVVLKADLLSVYHYPHNERSKRVIEKCGFLYEGRLRQAKKRLNGERLDECCYSLTREEYEAREGI